MGIRFGFADSEESDSNHSPPNWRIQIEYFLICAGLQDTKNLTFKCHVKLTVFIYATLEEI